jgi:hypothetical protein
VERVDWSKMNGRMRANKVQRMEKKEKSRRRGDKYHADPNEAIDDTRDPGRAYFVDVVGVHEKELMLKKMQHYSCGNK